MEKSGGIVLQKINAYRILVYKPEGKQTIRRTRCGRKDNIEIGFKETGGGRVWTGFIWFMIGRKSGLL